MSEISSTHALYIHWPFCRKKCPYCDFNSHVRESVDVERWQHALLAELEWSAVRADSRPLSSIFFGGGTPSLMPPALAGALIEMAEKRFGFAPEIEITLEANPTSVEIENFRALRQAGVNRLSLGVQSFDDKALAFLGREHSAHQALQAIDAAQSIFPRSSFDLIYALPEQSLNQWEDQLTEALKLTAGRHLSLYQLTIEPGTQFFHHHQSGKLVMPKDELLAGFYELTQQMMEAAQMPAYEVSNHAKAGDEARHNVHIWRGGSYLGIGPGAHGRMETPSGDRLATITARSPEKYLQIVEENGHALESLEALSIETRQEERILMGLRLREGIPRSIGQWQESYLALLQDEELIRYDATWLRPTLKGQLVLNSLTAGLVQRSLQ